MGKVLVSFLVMMSWAISIQAQTKQLVNDSIVAPTDSIFKTPEIMPEFAGGEVALMEYLKKVPYPPKMYPNGGDLEATVYVQFFIEVDGTLSEVEIAHSSGHKLLDDKAIEHVKAMPNWKPAYFGAHPVRVQFVVPVKQIWH